MYQFDLGKAIAAWRHSLVRNRAFLEEDLDELEEHLRDYVQNAIEEGMDVESAYRTALRRLGAYHELESAYRSVRLGKSKRRRNLLKDLALSADLLKSYLRVALRSFTRQKGYSFINVAGLAVAIACCLLIGAHIQDELGYDRFHERAQDIYRVNMVTNTGDRANIAGPIAGAMEAIPAVQSTLRLFKHWESPLVAKGENAFVEESFYFADSSFFDVFSFRLIRGEVASVLSAPRSVVLSETAARRYFGDADPISQTILYDGEELLTVMGIMADSPRASHIHPEMVASMSTLPLVSYSGILDEWWVFYTYLVLSDKAVVDQVAERAAALVKAAMGWEEPAQLRLVPLTDIHLNSHLADELEVNADIKYVLLLGVVGILILVIACINYMNLATARASVRAREIGVRKSAGAGKGQIAGQFMGESVVMVTFAFCAAIILVLVAGPLLTDVVGKDLVTPLIRPFLVPIGLSLILVVGFIAGSYPALVMARLGPASILKGDSGFGGQNKGAVRRLLVVGQFAASVTLIIGTLVVIRQLEFVQSTDLGFEAGGVLTVPVQTNPVREGYAALSESWLTIPGVESVGASASAYPGKPHSGGHQLRSESMETSIPTQRNWVDSGYFKVLGIELVAGRVFDATSEIESEVTMLNESAAKALGWSDPAEAVGKSVFLGSDGTKLEVVGVARDFHFESLHHRIEPLILSPNAWPTVLLVRVQGQPSAAMESLKSAWSRISPDPFMPSYLSDELGVLYAAERQWAMMLAGAGGLAIFIACLGLLGLAAFMTQRRTREIGIRKVLGATTASIVTLLAEDIVKLVLIAILVAVPVTWWATDRWLDNFAYRTDVGVGVFVMGGVVLLVVALVTVSFQSIRAAASPPIHSLRTD